MLLFLLTVVKSQAHHTKVGEKSDSVIAKQNIHKPNDTTISIGGVAFEEYTGKNNTVDAIHHNHRFLQNVAPRNEDNGSIAIRTKRIVLLNATDYKNSTIRNRDNVKDEVKGENNVGSYPDGFWYPKYCKSKRCKIIVGIATYLYDTLDSISRFITKIIGITRYIVNDTKKYRLYGDCGSGTIWAANRDGDEWQVAISIFTGGEACDTAASEKEIRRALECAISDKTFQNKLSFCIIMDDGHSWYAKVRFLRQKYSNYDDIWNIECRCDNDKHYAYEDGCIEDHISDEL